MMIDWNGRHIDSINSRGGVEAVYNPYDNFIRPQNVLWPPSEIVQKLYGSIQKKSFEKDTSLSSFGYYSDLQSINSEDAITWSVFGSLSRYCNDIRTNYVNDLIKKIGCHDIEDTRSSEISLWRRLPHPGNLTPGGPEIDFLIQTENTLVLGESKWKSKIGINQGVKGDQDQIGLRIGFIEKYAKVIYPEVKNYIVLVVGIEAQPEDKIRKYQNVDNRVKYTDWKEVINIAKHPLHTELKRYFDWKLATGRLSID